MKSSKNKSAQVLLAAIVAAMIVLPVAFAGAQGPTASASVGAKKQLKALSKKIGKLSKRIATLEASKPTVPTTLPPSGPAGGDLAGAYPNPTIGTEKVGTNALAFGGVTGEDLDTGSVGGLSLATATATVGTGVTVNPGETKTATVTCPGSSRLLGGGFEWSGADKNGASIISSSPTFVGDAGFTWEVQARVDTGGQANTVFAEALCLNA